MSLFSEAGVDKEFFNDIDSETLNEMFEKSEYGYKKKFFKRMQEWKNSLPLTPHNTSLTSTRSNSPMISPITNNSVNDINIDILPNVNEVVDILAIIRMLFFNFS